jgi:hypothetical protein
LSHLDDHDAALRNIAIFFVTLGLILRLGPVAFVTQRYLQARLFTAPPFLFLAATDLFNDPRFEHSDENL